jgi:hypothetical protein
MKIVQPHIPDFKFEQIWKQRKLTEDKKDIKDFLTEEVKLISLLI